MTDVSVPQAQFARTMNVTRQAVSLWAKAGRLELDADGNVLVEASKKRIAETQNTRGGKHGAKPAAAPPSEPPPTGAPLQYELDPNTLTGARTAQARARAKLDEMELAERTGALVERARYDQGVADGLSPILSRLDSLSSRAAPKLLMQGDVRRIIDILDDEVIAIRQEIADTLRAMAAAGEATKQ